MSELSLWFTFLEYCNSSREYKFQTLVIRNCKSVNSDLILHFLPEMQRKALHVTHGKISSQQLLGFFRYILLTIFLSLNVLS